MPERPEPRPRGPFNSPGFWLHHAALAWRHEVDVRLRPLGLKPTQFNLLASANWLSATSGPPSQQQVADMAGADRMMASKVIGALETQGLLVREPDPDDSRAYRVRVTDEGTAVVRRAVAIVAEVDAEVFGPLSASRERFTTRLRAVADHHSAR